MPTPVSLEGREKWHWANDSQTWSRSEGSSAGMDRYLHSLQHKSSISQRRQDKPLADNDLPPPLGSPACSVPFSQAMRRCLQIAQLYVLESVVCNSIVDSNFN